jgi:hypothetical protein
VGHGGWCWHIGGIFRCVVVMTSPVAITQSEPSVALRASIRRDFASPLLHRLETHHPAGRFIPTALPLRVVRGGRKGLVHLESACMRLVRAVACSYEQMVFRDP